MSIPRLYPVDATIKVISCVVEDYIYYPNSSTSFKRILSSAPNGTGEVVCADIRALTGSEADELTYNMFVASNGLVFIMTNGLASQTYKVFVSDDNFATLKTTVLKSGWDGTTHLAVRRMLGQHSMCDATLADGSQVVLFAEYNVGSSPWNTHIWKYDIATATWSRYWQARGAASAARYHMHSIYQDPYTMDIIISSGDTDSDSAIIIGKPTSDWSSIDDVLPANIVATDSTFKVLSGIQKYRCIDLLITEDYYYSHTDAGETASIGIYRFPKDLSSYDLVYSPNDLESAGGNVVGGAGFITASGKLLFADFLNGKGADIPEKSDGDTMRVHLSEDGITWKTVGKWLFETTRTTARWGSAIGQANDGRIWIGGSCSNNTSGLGGLNRSACFVEKGEWNAAYGEEVLSPVLRVSPHGSDSNNGYTIETPLLTLKAALASANATFGARIILTAGRHTSPAAVLDYQGNAGEGNTENPVIVEGVDGQTILEIDTDNLGHGAQGSLGDGDITFRSIRVISNYGAPLFVDAGDYDGTAIDNTTKGEINWR